MYDTDSRRFLSALCHGSIFLSGLVLSIAVPFTILFVSKDPVVKQNAKEAINLHFNVWLYLLIITPLVWVLVWVTLGLSEILYGVWLVLHWGLTIWALFNVLSNPDKPFRYPFIFRLL